MTWRKIIWGLILALATSALALIIFFAYILIIIELNPADTTQRATPNSADGSLNFTLLEKPRDLPELRFLDAQAREIFLSQFKGKVILLNIWATWCGPCRREMPSLDRLQTKLGGPDFEVLALSIDRKGLGVVKSFYQELGIRALDVYIDASAKSQRKLLIHGLPTTLLIDKKGRELGRHIGPAEWDSPHSIAFLRQHITLGQVPLINAIVYDKKGAQY